jgi:4-aminobutyrate aminotransferase-like enzyme
MFAFEHGGIVPDIVTMAKGLTSSMCRWAPWA